MTDVDALTLLTFNAGLLQYKLFGLRVFRNPPFTWRRLRHLPTALRAANADIVALQEVFEESQVDYLVESLRLIYPFAARRISGGYLALHNGLLILSKFPVVSTRFQRFQSITWSESLLGSKGILEAVIQVPGIGLVCVLNVHMASGTTDPESKALDAVRAEETEEVLAMAEAAEERGEIPMVLGDFNASQDVCPASYRTMLKAEWEDAFASGGIMNPPRFDDEDEENEDHRKDHVTIVIREGGATPSEEYGDTSASLANAVDAFATPDAESLYNKSSGLGEITRKSSKLDAALVNLSTAADLLAPARLLGGKSLYTDRRDLDSTHSDEWPLMANESKEWTWDPRNSLNLLGPHSGCHGLRCDHVFLPPPRCRRELVNFQTYRSRILFDKPRVLVQAGWLQALLSPMFGAPKGPLLITLSDHYAVKVELRRMPPEDTSIKPPALIVTETPPQTPPQTGSAPLTIS